MSAEKKMKSDGHKVNLKKEKKAAAVDKLSYHTRGTSNKRRKVNAGKK